MSFLDNLENNLKTLESREEGRDDAERRHRAREAEKAEARAVEPWADQLKKGPYTAELLRQTARVGHELRVKVNIAWLGKTLRLEARNQRLELRPTPEGIVAAFLEDGREPKTEPLDLAAAPELLLRRWLGAPGLMGTGAI